MTLILPATPSTGDLFSAFNHVETFTAALIERIPGMADDDVVQTRERAREMGKAAWRIECACDAEILSRTQARRGRGNVDIEGTGIVATVNSVAASVGVEPRTIFRNAQIHNTFFGGENTDSAVSILEDKQFYTAALSAPDPQAAVEAMAAKKADNPFYSTRDAQRDVLAMKRPDFGTPSFKADGVYSLLYADPPWRYDVTVAGNRAIENHYPTMEDEEICALPVQKITADDAVLFLWATSPKLVEAMRVMEAWGFTYKTCMVWVKDKIGMGYYARQRHELLLIGTVGALPTPAPSDRPDSVISATREAHSKKPLEVYETLERMYPREAKVELFCREPRAGWDVWGNQV